MNPLPAQCPSCQSKLKVGRLQCPDCETVVVGSFRLPALASLSTEDQEFIVQFVTAGGSLKEMANLLKVSYPTVRNRLDQVIVRLQNAAKEEED